MTYKNTIYPKAKAEAKKHSIIQSFIHTVEFPDYF
jgi:hypothetical protein